MPGEHAEFSPSKLGRIIGCPGSLKLSKTLPEPPESKYAAEGTLLHNFMVKRIAGDILSLENPEHETLVEECYDQFNSILDSTVSPAQIYQDIRVYMTDEVHGTLDVGINATDSIHVIDFKFGAGVEVSVSDNPQLLAYLDGFCKYINYDVDKREKDMYMWIFQPRLGHFDKEQVFGEDLLYFRARVAKAIALANSDYPPFHPGAYQCRFCPAGGVCTARLAEVQNASVSVLTAFADADSWNDSAQTIEQLAELLKMKGRVMDAFNAVEEHLFTCLIRNNPVPGFKLVSGRASRSWDSSVDVETLGQALPELDTGLLLKIELKSPAQVEKLLPKKEHHRLKDFIVVNEGKPTMAAETSSKQALDTSGLTQEAKAAKAFEGMGD